MKRKAETSEKSKNSELKPVATKKSKVDMNEEGSQNIFDFLPAELNTLVYSYLDVKTQRNANQVCKLFKDVSDDVMIWRNNINNHFSHLLHSLHSFGTSHDYKISPKTFYKKAYKKYQDEIKNFTDINMQLVLTTLEGDLNNIRTNSNITPNSKQKLYTFACARGHIDVVKDLYLETMESALTQANEHHQFEVIKAILAQTKQTIHANAPFWKRQVSAPWTTYPESNAAAMADTHAKLLANAVCKDRYDVVEMLLNHPLKMHISYIIEALKNAQYNKTSAIMLMLLKYIENTADSEVIELHIDKMWYAFYNAIEVGNLAMVALLYKWLKDCKEYKHDYVSDSDEDESDEDESEELGLLYSVTRAIEHHQKDIAQYLITNMGGLSSVLCRAVQKGNKPAVLSLMDEYGDEMTLEDKKLAVNIAVQKGFDRIACIILPNNIENDYSSSMRVKP